jgi:hypothetical protein
VDISRLKRIYSSIAGQRSALDGLRGSSCIDVMSVAGAVAFGAVPVKVADGKIALATAGTVHPDCAKALAEAFDDEVVLFPFEESLVREAIDRHYVRRSDAKHGPNLQTFESPDFLTEPGVGSLLLVEKDDSLPKARVRVPRGRMAFLDLRFHSIHRSLDRRVRIEFSSAPSALPFRLVKKEGAETEAVLFRDERPAREVRAIMALGVFYDGDDHLQALLGQDLKRLPHILHPTELQIAEIEDDEVRFWVYDRIESVRAGVPSAEAPVGWSHRYYFLHYGLRHERVMRLDVLSFELIKRTKVRLAEGPDRSSPEGLERLFGLDFPSVVAPGERSP